MTDSFPFFDQARAAARAEVTSGAGSIIVLVRPAHFWANAVRFFRDNPPFSRRAGKHEKFFIFATRIALDKGYGGRVYFNVKPDSFADERSPESSSCGLSRKQIMIEPFWDVVRRFVNNETDAPDSVELSSHEKNSEDSFLAALPVVRKIVRRRFVSLRQAEASDLEQGIVLRLLKWREKYPDISAEMSSGDWESFAARAAYNETNRHFSRNGNAKARLPLDAAFDVESPERVIGDSNAEFQSLASFVWQGICQMTLRQRRALLLQNRKLILDFLKGGIRDEELARSLEISENEWLEVKIKIPLPDAGIARLNGADGERSNLETAIKSIKKARHEARGKLRKLTNK